MAVQSVCETTWMVVGAGEDLFELFVGQTAGFFSALDGHLNFAVDPTAAVNQGKKVVRVNDFIRDDVDVELHVLVVLEWCIKGHVADAEGHESRARGWTRCC